MIFCNIEMTKKHTEKKIKPAKWRIYEMIYGRYPKIQEAYKERNSGRIWKAWIKPFLSSYKTADFERQNRRSGCNKTHFSKIVQMLTEESSC